MNAFCLAGTTIPPGAETPRRIRYSQLFTFILILLLAGGLAYAGVTASISGTVTDPSGAAVAGATVTATNVGTGVAATQQTNSQGFYSFQSLPLGTYTIEVEQKGFKSYKQTGLVLDVNSALVVDVVLQVGQTNETVEVSSSALHVDTASTQMGEVIEGKEMTDVPLVSRSYTDLLALQPGVVATSSGMNGALGGSFTSAGFSPPLVSGSLNAGAQSVNGMREAANGFLLNGILVQETGYSGAGAIPNLDSIAEFRILTNNFDAEYGNYSGGQINVVTKSGTNDWHGNAFEFFRNTDLDAKNFFDGINGNSRGAYHQNQFGGTFGGPIKRDKIFFFADYQGNRVIQPETQVITGAPSAATEQGDFSGIAQSLTGTVNGANWAKQLSSQLGQTVTAGEKYYFNGCVSYANCVFPNAQLPTTAFSSISSKLLSYILPAAAGTINPTTGTGTFSTNSGKLSLNDNKFSGRLDANTSFGLLSGYYYFDRFNRVDPYWQSNAPLYPGFSVDSNGQTNNINLGDTKTFGSASVNEFRLGYFRLDTKFNQPLGGKGTSLADLGFAAPANGGIYPGTPSVEGIPEIDFNNFVIGVPSRPNQLVENIYQILDNYSRVIGTHTVKFGAQYHYNQLEENLSNVANGNFFFGPTFSGGQPSETGSDFVDFLLGAPSSYVQGQSYPSYGRNFYFGLYAQDSWRIKSNLTFNYGLRYDVSAPWHEKYNEIQTLIPGEQSVVFPGSPIGWVFPGDPGVPSSLAPTRWNNFAPRLGLAYSFGDHDGLLGSVLGKPGTTSIRAAWGMFYTSFEGATDFNEIGDAPFGNYTGQNESTFAAPFINRATGAQIPNLFPVAPPPKNFSAKNPATGYPYDNLTDFYGAFGTIGSSPAFYNKNRLPYAENYELSIERQLTPSDLLTVSYVGTQAHRLLASESANPGIPSLCLQLLNEGAIAEGTTNTTCGPGNENLVYQAPNGTVTASTRGPFSAPYRNTPVNGQYIVPFGNDSYFITGSYSSYNSLQINWRHTSGRLQTLVGYTFSKSLDNASGYGEQYNPINPRLSRGLSAFDSPQNFVASYAYTLPIDKLDGPKKLTNGWQISGITRFATGLPVTILETDDRSLLGTGFGGPITLPVDTPNLLGQVQTMNPRNNPNHYFFTTSSFGPDVLGQEGDANRRFFHGPGINNWDFAVTKNTQLTERFNLQFRAELFNIFNHAQFITPSGLVSYNCANITETSTCSQSAGNFGQVTAAAAPRIGQLSLKLNF
ncbi:MAG: carboxypeptidase regulatory-like domain-containing protein [Candidatus Acidiferrum sp.]